MSFEVYDAATDTQPVCITGPEKRFILKGSLSGQLVVQFGFGQLCPAPR